MRTVSQAVEEIIGRSPFLQEAMSEGIANNASVARKIKPEVEKRLYEEVSEAAIAMALHRIGTRLTKPHYGSRFVKKMADITVRSNLVEFSFPNSPYVFEKLEAVSRAGTKRRDTFFNLSRGVREGMLIVDAESAAAVEGALGRVHGVERSAELSAITMQLPEESLAVPGVYHAILKSLAMEGISIVEVVSVRAEFTVVFKNADIDRAFSVLKRLTA